MNTNYQQRLAKDRWHTHSHTGAKTHTHICTITRMSTCVLGLKKKQGGKAET